MVLLKGRSRRAADSVLQLMQDAVYTLCPEGDTPDSERIYHAISHGSIPVLNDAFQPPPLVDWSTLSTRIIIGASRSLVLPSRQLEQQLQLGVFATDARAKVAASHLEVRLESRRPSA